MIATVLGMPRQMLFWKQGGERNHPTTQAKRAASEADLSAAKQHMLNVEKSALREAALSAMTGSHAVGAKALQLVAVEKGDIQNKQGDAEGT